MGADGRQRHIAVFDSGLGGVSVLKALVHHMPSERFYYFGDSANAPYGSKPFSIIRELTLRHAERFFKEGAKALVVACNTATSVAIEELRETYPEHIIIGIEPALKPAIKQFPEGKIVVMATETTLREKKFEELAASCAHRCEVVKCPCPELVKFVERGELEGEAAEKAISQYLRDSLEPAPDAIVLGCTHFPFLRKSIRAVVGEKPLIFDGAEGTALQTRRRLSEEGLLADGDGEVRIENSAEGFLELANRLLHEGGICREKYHYDQP